MRGKSGWVRRSAADTEGADDGSKPKKKVDVLFYIMLIAVIISAAYWIAVCINLYNNYSELADLGGFTMSMYYDIHYPAIAHGLQFISFDNHISPDMVIFVLPFYALFQSPITLLVIQALMVCFTALLLYLIANDLLKDGRIALLLGIAFLVDPGTWYMIISEFHTEPFFVPLYLLAFYFFMKKDTIKFIVASIFLLGVMEFSPFVAGSLGIGLLFYSYFRAERDWQGVKLSVLLVIFSGIAYILYALTVSSLLAGYSNGTYPNVPLIIRATPQTAEYESVLAQLPTNISNFVIGAAGAPDYAIFAFLTAFLSLGFFIYRKAIIALILLLPWWINAIILYNPGFYEITHYYSFALCGLFVSAIIAIVAIQQRESRLFNIKVVKYSLIAFPVMTLLFSTYFLSQSATFYRLGQNFFFQSNAAQQLAIGQLNSVVNQLPANASVYTTYFIFPHVAQRKNLEVLSPPGYYYIRPQFVLVDFNMTVNYQAFAFNQTPVFISFFNSNSGNYTPYAKNGSAVLFKLTNSSV